MLKDFIKLCIFSIRKPTPMPPSLTSIALDCGFYSSQHFSSRFSRWVGKTPSKYRNLDNPQEGIRTNDLKLTNSER